MYTSALALRTTLITAVSLQLIPSMQSPEHRYLAIAFCTWLLTPSLASLFLVHCCCITPDIGNLLSNIESSSCR